jgi:hypothetical protein
MHCRSLGRRCWSRPGRANVKLKKNVQISNKCLIEKLLLEQMFVADLMFIFCRSRPNFGNALLVAGFTRQL